MENYMKFKLMGGLKRMKKHVVPHVFDYQPDRKRAFSQPPRLAATKRAKRQNLADAIASSPASNMGDIVSQLEYHKQDLKAPDCSSSKSTSEHTEPQGSYAGFTEELLLCTSAVSAKKDISVQVRPKMRSKRLQCNLHCGVTVGLSPLKISTSNVATTPTKPSTSGTSVFLSMCESEIFSEDKSSEQDSDYAYNLSEGSEEYQLSISESEAKEDLQKLSLKCTIQKLQKRPRLYLGLAEYAYYIFQLLETYSTLENKYIFLTLKKIRTAHSFSILADDFGITEVHASRIFSTSVPIISKFLRKCIFTPSVNTVKLNLPLVFRARYSNVFCIIDCLEIEIEKSSDSVKQSLTWSDYKNCNTLKYLISCTPDGIINFISTGFGGRASDAIIVEHSGFLNILPQNVAIMADRGFKNIAHLLLSKNCILVRPPSVSATVKLTKSEVFETKRIASLRIHVERVIRRVREFSFLAPHACIDIKLIPHTDQIIKIVCGLINLQSGIISGK